MKEPTTFYRCWLSIFVQHRTWGEVLRATGEVWSDTRGTLALFSRYTNPRLMWHKRSFKNSRRLKKRISNCVRLCHISLGSDTPPVCLTMPCFGLVVKMSMEMIKAAQLPDCELMFRIISHDISNCERGLVRHQRDVGVIQPPVCQLMPCFGLVVKMSMEMIKAAQLPDCESR
jgi:hypothetical protein